MKKYTLSKNERLKNKKTIDSLFIEPTSISVKNIRAVYRSIPQEKTTLVAFSVGKKNFKKAVDRNILKRRMREVYRLNKEIITNDTFHILFIYTSRKILNYSTIEEDMCHLLKKLNLLNNSKNE